MEDVVINLPILLKRVDNSESGISHIMLDRFNFCRQYVTQRPEIVASILEDNQRYITTNSINLHLNRQISVESS